MINERREAQNEMEVVMIEQLVPQDHLLRKIDKYIDKTYKNSEIEEKFPNLRVKT